MVLFVIVIIIANEALYNFIAAFAEKLKRSRVSTMYRARFVALYFVEFINASLISIVENTRFTIPFFGKIVNKTDQSDMN